MISCDTCYKPCRACFSRFLALRQQLPVYVFKIAKNASLVRHTCEARACMGGYVCFRVVSALQEHLCAFWVLLSALRVVAVLESDYVHCVSVFWSFGCLASGFVLAKVWLGIWLAMCLVKYALLQEKRTNRFVPKCSLSPIGL